ncbi:hypothetical protein TREPR_0232 [Treponema primitia ZAS-2]|uniref:Uncharacterized protein n=1 Tax=Treponema primitia (strain ATCC BAA-887 / DSM 12427 / ZAS-2) TaxID=545694 RepID=F5YLL4_TREPZ|nr:hypothetical protein TREPR_0232 [Treponema primitia ZAS-2]
MQRRLQSESSRSALAPIDLLNHTDYSIYELRFSGSGD